MNDRSTPSFDPQSNGSPEYRELVSGTIHYTLCNDGAALTASKNSEIFVRISGRGRIVWPGDSEDSRDHRALGIFLLPPATELRISGSVNGLRIEIPSLIVDPPARPLSDALIGLACRRAWHGSENVAEASLTLARLLILDELDQHTE